MFYNKWSFFKGYRWLFVGLFFVGMFLISQVSVSGQVRSVGLFESVSISANFKPDPLVLRGISGGAIAASGIAGKKESPNGSCVGFVDEPADHVITLKVFFKSLSLQVESADDTTLVVRGPGGSWCNDDAPNRGKNAGISGEWLAGTYKIWVGSYQEKKYQPYVIRLSQK